MGFETEWIERLIQMFGRTGRGLAMGIGSDCAVLAQPLAATLVSTDTQVEGVHFDTAFMTFADVGYRAVTCALSDLAAGGCDADLPFLVFLSAAFPNRLSGADREQIAEGIGDALREHDATLAGGDTVLTPGPVTITATVIGQARRPLHRGGARPGDAVLVVGHLGGAGGALHLFHTQQATEHDDDLLAAYRRPRALLRIGGVLASVGASACADVSDGLMLDVSRIGERSGVALELDLDRLPIHPALVAHAAFDDERRMNLAATFGDDYALVATSPAGRVEAIERAVARAGTLCTTVGRCAEGAAGEVRATWRKEPYRPERPGYEH
ncbi:MAG: thiamine-phosphate kinase [Deltaproteobacteria bacterium]|nr:thiamine-phosphate kinase [Deltaproteobacteria bacterium]